MLTKERETQFCNSRDEIKDRLNYLKITLPEANGKSESIGNHKIHLFQQPAKLFYGNAVWSFFGNFSRSCRDAQRIYSGVCGFVEREQRGNICIMEIGSPWNF